MGQFGGPGFSQWCSQAIPRLVQVIQAADAREQENVNPTENAISAVTKILKYNQAAVNLEEILPVWYVIFDIPSELLLLKLNSGLWNIKIWKARYDNVKYLVLL